jgi:hypothetical protein
MPKEWQKALPDVDAIKKLLDSATESEENIAWNKSLL